MSHSRGGGEETFQRSVVFSKRAAVVAMIVNSLLNVLHVQTAGHQTPSVVGKELIEPEISCPKGFDLDGLDCVKTSILAPTGTCPQDFQPIYEDGTTSSRSSLFSRNNSRSSSLSSRFSNKMHPYRSSSSSSTKKSPSPLSNKKHAPPSNPITECVRSITAPSIPFCSADYELSVGGGDLVGPGGRRLCVKYEEVDAELHCSSGFHLRADSCVRSTVHDPGLTCGDRSFTMVGEECRRIIEMQPIEGCPEKHVMEMGRCVRVEREIPFDVCPQGTVPVQERCLRTVSTPGRPICPEEYILEGDECVKDDIIIPEEMCDGDSVMTNGDCVNERILDASFECDEGFTMDPSGDCVQRRPPHGSCPDGGTYSADLEKCALMESILPAINCPPGYGSTEDDECIKTDIIPAEYTCPTGFTLNGRECDREEISTPEQKCPDLFMLNGDLCLKPTYQDKWQKCQNGFELVTERCIATEEIAPDMICPEGFELRLDKCVEERSVEPDQRCAADSEYRGGRCVHPVSVPAEQRCEEPFRYNGDTGLCENKEVAAPNLDCPPEYTFDGDCVLVITQAAEPRCPDNHYYDDHYHNCKPNKRYVPALPPLTPSLITRKQPSSPEKFSSHDDVANTLPPLPPLSSRQIKSSSFLQPRHGGEGRLSPSTLSGSIRHSSGAAPARGFPSSSNFVYGEGMPQNAGGYKYLHHSSSF